MVHCFLTGVQLPIELAYVLNRREARNLLVALNDRVASLRRVVEQLSPLDVVEPGDVPAHGKQRVEAARKQHRLICPALASALAAAFPETKLFLPWAEHRALVKAALQRRTQPGNRK